MAGTNTKFYQDPKSRAEAAKRSHFIFHNTFLSNYVTYPTAPFQREMFRLTEDSTIKLAVITAFRGSGKSTIMTLSYPIWSVVGAPQKKFVVLLAKTQSQAKTHFANLKREFESNELLRADLGPFETQEGEWGSLSIVLPKYGARITAASSEQAIRGIKHGSHRPDLIVADDPDDLSSVKTLESREKTWAWFTGEVIPLGDKSTQIVVVGNLLHDDSLVTRLRDQIRSGFMNGVYYKYPLVNDEGAILWTGKYPDEASIDELRKSVGDESAFQREYLLKIITSDDQVIRPEWITYYGDIPTDNEDYRYIVTGVDLAISEEHSADCTAMVSARVYGLRENLKVYILPNPINERIDFPTQVKRLTNLSNTLGGGHPTKLVIEDVGYQRSLIQQLDTMGFPVEGFKPQGHDKRERLSLVSNLIQQGKVLFPDGDRARMLIQQLVGFGREKHDDLSDAFAIALLYILGTETSGITIPDGPWNHMGEQTSKTREDLDREADLELIEKSHYERSGGNYHARNRFGGSASGFTW